MTREVFQTVCAVDRRRLLPGLLLQLLPAALMGVMMAVLRANDYYILLLMPAMTLIIPAMLAGGIAVWMRWREPRRAAAVGFAIGALGYLSHLYFLMVYFIGWQQFWRIDVLPEFAFNLMNHMAIDDEVNPTLNWFFTAVEASLVGGAFAWAHHLAAKRVYCPRCGGTLKSKSSILPPDFATALAYGIQEHHLEELPHDTSGGEIEGDAWSNVELQYCFHGGEASLEPLFYLTLAETRYEEGVKYRTIVFDKLLLTPDEMLSIAEKCPGLNVLPKESPVV